MTESLLKALEAFIGEHDADVTIATVSIEGRTRSPPPRAAQSAPVIHHRFVPEFVPQSRRIASCRVVLGGASGRRHPRKHKAFRRSRGFGCFGLSASGARGRPFESARARLT